MNAQLFATHIGIPQTEVQELMAMGSAQIYESTFYFSLVESLDYTLLSRSLHKVRGAYEAQLPDVVANLRTEHNYRGKPMTAATLSNWILGFLHNPTHLVKMVEIHHRVPTEVLEVVLPQLLDILDSIGPEAAEWKRALALLSLPLYAAS